jgi:hypothetical protein
MFFILSLIFSLPQKSENKRAKRAKKVLPGSSGGEVAQIMYTHISKCKNDKIKLKLKK